MPNKPRPLSINLLPQDPFYETTLGRVMLWASNIGRYLVIFTELIVIISFGTRFKLDRDLSDLNTLIAQKSSLIDSYGSLEEDVRTIQKKTQFITQQQALTNPLDVMNTIARHIPQNTSLSLAQVHDQQVQITGTTLTSRDFAAFIQALQADSSIQTLSVDQVRSSEKGTAGFQFIMRISFAQVGNVAQVPESVQEESVEGIAP